MKKTSKIFAHRLDILFNLEYLFNTPKPKDKEDRMNPYHSISLDQAAEINDFFSNSWEVSSYEDWMEYAIEYINVDAQLAAELWHRHSQLQPHARLRISDYVGVFSSQWQNELDAERWVDGQGYVI